MASFDDIRAKMNKKYGDSEEEKKKQQEQKGVSPSAATNFSTIRNDMNSKYNSSYSRVDENFINTFLSDAKSFLNSAYDNYSGMGYSNRDTVYEEHSKKADELKAKSWDIRQYLTKNKDSLKEEDYNSFMAMLDDFDKTAMSTNYSLYRKKQGISKFENEAYYNEHQRQQELGSMSSAEIEEARKGRVIDQEDQNIIHELMLSNMPYRRDYAEQDGRDMGLYDEVEQKRKYISDKYGVQFTESSYENDRILTDLMNGDTIAYTTYSGQNITWDSLYNNALLNEDLASRFDTYSKNADWAEKSQAINTVADTESDYQILTEVALSGVPYDWETAEATGIDKATFDHIEGKRRYISDKYGVDLYSDIYNNANILNDLMSKLEEQEGEKDVFEYISYLEPQEKSVLSYIYETEGRAAALAWHNSRKDIYRSRYNASIAAGWSDLGKEHPFWGSVGSVALNLGASVEYLDDIFRYAATGETPDNTMARAASSIRSGVMDKYDWNWGDADVFDFLYGTFMSGVDSWTAGKLGSLAGVAAGLEGEALASLAGNIGGTQLGLSAAGQATNDALARGMSDGQAISTGIAAGIFEGLFEKWSIGSSVALQQVTSAHGWDIANNIAKSVFINASEEFNTEVANIFYDAIFNGDFSQYETAVRQYMAMGYSQKEAKTMAAKDLGAQVAEAAASGALMGFGFGGIDSSGAIWNNAVNANKTAAQTYSIGKATLNADGGMDALQALAMDVSGASDSKLAKKANKLDGDISTGEGKIGKAVAGVKNMAKSWKAGQVHRAIGSTVSEKNKADLTTALKENGISEKSAKNIADAVVASLDGKQLSNFQKSTLESFNGNKKVGDIITKVFNDADSSVKQRISNLAKFNLGIKFGVGVAPGDSTASAVESKAKTIEKTSYEVSEGGKTILDGTEVKLNGLRKMEDGSVVVATADNQTADPSEVQYPSEGHALIYENYANIETTTNNPVIANMDVKDRSTLAMAFDPASGVAAKAQFLGLNHAYWYGFEGMTMDEKTLPENTYIKDITEKQRNTAYELGREAAEKAAKTQKAGLDAAYEKAVEKLGGEEKAKAIAAKKSGNVILGTGIKESSMTLKEKASYEMAKVVAKSVGTDIHIYRGMKEYGKYSSKTGDIWLNINANISGQSMMAFTLGHELVHMAKQWSSDKFKAFADYLLEQYGKKGISVEVLIREQMANAKLNGYTLDEHEAYEEVIADACQRMLLDSDAVQKMAEYKKENPGQWQQIIDKIKEFIDKIRKAFAGVEPDSNEAALFKELDDFAKNELQKRFVDMVMDAGEHLSVIRAAFGKGTVVEVNANGEFTLAKGKDSNGATKFLYNDYTWEKGGRDTLSAALKAEGYSEEDIKAALTIMDGKHDLVKQLEAQFPEQARINQATITTDLKDGHSVLSALVSNGDYPVNIDLLMVCKKRKAYQRVINRLCETGMIQQATVDALAIAEINKILGKYGFETACLGCFVESRRLRIQEWANTIVKEWNAEVKKRNPNAKAFGFGKGEATLTPDEVMQLVGELESGGEKNDQGNLNLGQGSAVKRMGVPLDKVPSLRKTLSVEDLITPDGLTALRKFDSNLFSMVKSRYGSNSPKFVQEFNPYNHELAKYGKVPTEYKSLREYLYAIGGARMQSFSDFIVENWFDYCQIVADLAARKLPMHTYTKEIALAKLFGLTGIKINMSLIPDIDRSLGKEFAGLTRNEKGELELIWADKDRFKKTGGKSYMQSINFADAIALQNDPRYSANVGTIAVGVSDNHILMMLDDARIRMIIPYHSSGMNPIFADLMGTSYYKDYTMVQNTTVKQLYNSKGEAVSLKLDKTQNDKLVSGFQFNEVLQELGDARAAAQAYKDWCADASKHTITIKGETYTAELTPKFNDFSGHENYYKLLEDFNTYDCISEEAAPQGDVRQTYPEDFDETLKAELNAQEKHRQKQEESQAFDKAMGEIESYLSTHTKADTVFYAEQHGVKLSAKDKKLNAADKAKLADLRKGMKNSLPKVDSDGYQLSETVEETKDLLAFHNITAELLMDVLVRNRLLMPSIAITNKGMTDFGEISLLFDKSSIDPIRNALNKLYGADAWTPTQTELKKNAKFDTDKTVRTVNALKNRIGSKFASELFGISPKQFKDAILKADGSIYNAYAHDLGMQTAYAMEQGIISKIPTNKDGTLNRTALQEQVSTELDTDKGWRQYKKWLRGISDNIITSYDRASNQEILNDMKAQPATAKTFKLSESGELVVPAAEYGSIEDVRKNKNRLSEDAAEATKAVADEFLAFAKKLGGDVKGVVNAINASFANRYSTADIVKSFNSKGIKISLKAAGELQSLYKKAVELPTQYFEAKPQREVGLDEARAVVMPADDSYAELKGRLEDLGIQVIEYDGTDASRIEALNSMEDFKFSMPKVATDAVDMFGTTTNFEQAGFVLGDGRMLNLSQYGLNGVKHQRIEQVYDDVEGSEAINRFIQEGHVRIKASSPGIEIGTEVAPTVSQFNTISKFINTSLVKKGYFYLDITDKNGKSIASVEYDEDASTEDIIWDIKDYYDRGKIPKPSAYSYSMPKVKSDNSTYREPAYHEWDVQAALYDALDHADKGQDNLIRVGNMPRFVVDLLGIDGDFYIYRNHAYENMVTAEQAKTDGRFNAKSHYHDLGVDTMTEAVMCLEKPMMTIATKTKYGNPAVIMLLPVEGKNKAPLYAVLSFYSSKDINGDYSRKPHVVLTIAERNFIEDDGRAGIADVISNAVSDGRVISFDEKMRDYLTVNTKATSLGIISEQSLAINLAQFLKEIKSFKEKNHISYKAPNSHGMSPRQLLADAFDELVQTPDERKLMDQYRNNISKVEEVQERLRKLRAEISKLAKANGDKTKIADLNKTAKELAELIDKYDRKLLDLEASKPLKDVLARARSAAYQEAKKRNEETMKEYRQQVSERFDRGVEGRRKTEMRKKIRKVIRDLDKILNRGDKKRNVKEDMKDFVAEALSTAEVLFTDNYTNEDIIRNGFGVELSEEETKYLEEARKYMDELANLPVGGYDAWQARQEAEETLKNRLAYRMSKLKDAFFRERQRLNKAEVAEVLGNLADAYAKLEDSEYAYVNGAYHEAVYEYLKMLQDDVGGAKIKDMTLGQFEELYKAYTMVLTTVQNANKMFADDLKQSKEELANRVMMEVYQAGGEHGLWTKGQLVRNQASWNNTKPIYAAERTGSSTFVKLVKGLFKGQYNWAIDMKEAKAFRQKVAEKYGFKNWDMEKTYKFTSSSGIEFELNLNQIMSLYAYAKREQAHDHLLKGGFVFGKNTEVVVTKNGIKRTYLNKSAKAHNISDEIMGEIVSKLSKEQKGFVDEMQDYLSTTMGEKGNEVSLRLYGVKLFMEKFYFPLRSAGQFKEKAKEAELKQQQGQISIANSGFTHGTKPKASNPVVLDGFTDVWAGHVNEMSLYHSMVLPMEDFRRVYNYASPNMEGQESASVNSFIENAYGDAATGYFDQLYKELNGGAIVDPRENLSKQMIGRFKKAAVMLSNSVVVQQFSSIGRAYALIDPKYFIGPKVDKKKHAVLWAEVKQYAPVAIIKEMGGFDTHTGLSANDYLLAEEYSKGEIVKGIIKDDKYRNDLMGYLPAKADELTWCAIWEAVKRETKAKNPKMDVKSEEFLKMAGERFSEVIEKTQVYDSVLARSANMRSKQGLMQMLTAFMAEPTTTVNMVEDALRKGNKKTIARTFGAVAASVILNNALASIIYAMRDDDEDENFLEKYAEAFTSGMLDDINPLTYYPILKDIWSLFQGYDVERSDMAIYSDIAESVKKIVTLISKYDSEMDAEEAAEYYKKVMDASMSLLDGGASALGIPWKNIRRDLLSFYNTYKTFERGGSTTWDSFVDAVGGAALDTIPVVGWVVDESSTDNLYNAIISGDTTYANRLKSGYKDEDAYSNAVRKALRDNDPRVKEAALAQINGNPSERVRIAKLIIADGFSQDDVVRAINAEINAMTPNEQSEKKEKGFYTAEDFAREIANGDQAAANAAKSDVIRTAQKNGKTAEEAEKSFNSSAKSELKDLFLAGKVSEDKAVKALVTYCDETEEDALETVGKWLFEDVYGFSYSDRADAYKSGKISASEMKTILMEEGGKTAEEADLQIEAYDWEAQGYKGATAAAVREYNEHCASTNVPKDVYLYIRTFSNNTENDKDANGKSIAYSAMKKIMAEINAQTGLTSAQKTAIARSLGWAEKNIQKYKTW